MTDRDRQIARLRNIGWTAVVCGLCLAFFGLGRLTGFDSGVAHERRFGVAWMANDSAAALEVMSRGGVIETHVIDGGYQVTIHVDGKVFEATSTVREAAVMEAVAEWKNL